MQAPKPRSTWFPAGPRGNLDIPGYSIHCSEWAETQVGKTVVPIERLFWLRLISTQHLLLFTTNVSVLALF